ncbi:conserved hypothetical protein [Xanthomonas citri pv. citri]|uniref:HIT domain-containing protein n=1 Tax=Xanthomonas citri TaxID=346 RepID=UPI00052D4BC7|nr:HIT family protein [Xanthomonas citri]CEH72071.1 conserved hypothetical protein [Xanthomonas citri pv. citri]
MSDTAPGTPAGGFLLDPRLAADTVFVADGPLSQVRLMDDARFPWLVLVPRVADVSEWIDLDGGQQRLLLAEINQLSQLLRAEPAVSKLNIGALGNIVRQLHVHLVGRHPGDAVWPGPVWGSGSAQRFVPETLQQHVAAWAQRLR